MKASSRETGGLLVKKHFVPAFGSMKLSEIRKADVLAFYRKFVARAMRVSGNRCVAGCTQCLRARAKWA